MCCRAHEVKKPIFGIVSGVGGGIHRNSVRLDAEEQIFRVFQRLIDER